MPSVHYCVEIPHRTNELTVTRHKQRTTFSVTKAHARGTSKRIKTEEKYLQCCLLSDWWQLFFELLTRPFFRVLENSSELYSDSAHASNVVARKLGKRLGPEMDTHVSFFFFCNMFPAIIINFIVWLLHADSL